MIKLTIATALALALTTAARVAMASPSPVGVEVAGAESNPTTTFTVGQSPMIAPDGVLLTVTCKSPIDCHKVKLAVRGDKPPAPLPTPVPQPGGTDRTAVFQLPTDTQIELHYDALPTKRLGLEVRAKTDPPDEPPPPGMVRARLGQVVLTPCQKIELAPRRFEVFITPQGATLTPLPAYFSEADTLYVTVVGAVSLLDLVQVRRKSEQRTVTGRVLGEEAIQGKLITMVETAPNASPCGTRTFAISGFAPGTGEVEISTTGVEPATLGSFQLVVDPTYLGMFSLGAVWTPLIAPGFGVAMRGGQSVVTMTEAGDRRMSFALLFTPFLWDRGERDIRRPFTARRFYASINPSVGLGLDDAPNHLLAGATLDIQSTVLITAGAIFSHVRELDGIAVGDPFTGEAANLPTRRRWKRDWFVGVSVDLRVGIKLLRAVLGTAAGG